MEKVIEVENLTKKYANLSAVDNISFAVYRGETFGLLGENGAGKTTTLEMIEGLRKATSGKIFLFGKNLEENLKEAKERIGVQLQASAYFDNLTLFEILDLLGSFYSKTPRSPRELLKIVKLEEKSSQYVKNLSGGQKQRFSIVASLVNDPEIVFLDEPTTGLDPLARRHLWELINKIKSEGKTIILTTHYLEEAETLCDRVAIMSKGKIIALDKTHKLAEQTRYPFKLEFICENLSKAELAKLDKLGKVQRSLNNSAYEVKIKSKEDLSQALLFVQRIKPETFSIKKATLEDVFIELTGKTIEDEND